MMSLRTFLINFWKIIVAASVLLLDVKWNIYISQTESFASLGKTFESHLFLSRRVFEDIFLHAGYLFVFELVDNPNDSNLNPNTLRNS